ncbi:putative RNA-directed DNA polymerase from transposon BS [Araneus ventricosus]|uniref:Putative RNA-directed DNA polymerase from transposon BS n=1 Tax=Araneus ventricosus TaxID=182803 RepID=A0A4Y2W481_ARAVE|nr:putative RNA-directed DNA polymerase from transposon BS [Araneus ventricosus]
MRRNPYGCHPPSGSGDPHQGRIIRSQHLVWFQKNLSTSHQLLRITELIFDGFAKSETTGALFLDVAKAFDKIWHDGLLAKLMRLSCSAQFIKITHSFLTSRNFRVRVNNILSNPRPILSGYAQGSLLSPTLFNIYVNDIPNFPSCHLAIFADDTAILTKYKHPDIAVQTLQTYVSQLQLWLADWKIKVNPSKCACFLFTKKRNMPVLNPIQIFGQPVPFVSEYKYFGLLLDAKLNFDSHINRALTKARNSSFALGRLIAPKSTLKIKHKLLLYKAIVRPIMLYGSPIWGTTSIRNLRKLQVFQNQQLKRIVNAPWFK